MFHDIQILFSAVIGLSCVFDLPIDRHLLVCSEEYRLTLKIASHENAE